MTLHACARENISFPLCGAEKFTYVTPDLLRVTCDRCLSILGMMREKASITGALKESNVALRLGLHEARRPEAPTGMAPQSRSYFCMIDRFCYESRALGLIHMRLQHGVMNQETFLLRERLAGGPF